MKKGVSIFYLILGTVMLAAQPTLDFELQTLAGPALVQPVDIASANDGSGRLFIVEKRGTIRIIENDTVRSSYFLDVRPLGIATSGEAGLLGLAFHPNYPATPYLYVNYIKPGLITNVARFNVNPANPDDALENTELVLLVVDQPFDNHNAGDLAFGPDGYLYIALGDGGSAGDPDENGQDLAEMLGKILRLDVDNPGGGNNYGIPPTNPYVGVSGALDEIWDSGMRNPWRLSFDRETGDLWIGDVGQGIWEEIDFEPAGSAGGFNYGWDCYEGNAVYEAAGCGGMGNYDFPIFAYPHNCSQGPCGNGTGTSITGGFVYRGSDFPSLQGYYVCADYGSENIWLLTYDGTNTQITMQPGGSLFSQLCTFGEDEDGELYAAALGGGLYRVVVDGALPVYLTQFDAVSRGAEVELKWRVENSEEITSFAVERSTDKILFKSIGSVWSDPAIQNYTLTDASPATAINYYRLTYYLIDGGVQISEVRTIDRRSGDISSDVYTHAGGGLAVRLNGLSEDAQVALYTSDGRRITAFTLSDTYGEIPGTSDLQTGMYVVLVTTDTRSWAHKWLKG